MLEEHRVYLADRPRLRAYARALAATVRPGAVVLDLGAGTGILGILALRAGAGRVYAVDEGPILGAAREAAASVGFADRWIGIRGRSTEIKLPERADLVVADHVGGLGFDYGILEAFADARRRHLRRGARFVPGAVELHAALLESPRLYRPVSFWGGRPEGIAFPGIRRLAAHAVFFARPRRAEALSPAARLAAVDLARAGNGPVEGRARLAARRAGTVHGLLVWFRARLAPGVWMTSDPFSAAPVRRSPAFLPLERPLQVRRGERVPVEFRFHPASGAVAWTVAGARHGTAFGQLLDGTDLRRMRARRRRRSVE